MDNGMRPDWLDSDDAELSQPEDAGTADESLCFNDAIAPSAEPDGEPHMPAALAWNGAQDGRLDLAVMPLDGAHESEPKGHEWCVAFVRSSADAIIGMTLEGIVTSW